MKKTFEVKDSGTRQVFDTGAQRDIQEGKGRFDLLPPLAMIRIAKHFENGAGKYGIDNWKKGIPLRRYTDSMMRHSYKFLGGDTDEDHLSAIIWNAMCLIETQEMIKRDKLPKDLDDMPSKVWNDDENI